MTFTRAWLTDALERVVRAFLVAFIGQMLASTSGIYSVGAAKAAAAAGIASGLSVVLSLLGAANTDGGVSPASLVGSRRPKGQTGVTLVELLIVVVLILLVLFLIGALR